MTSEISDVTRTGAVIHPLPVRVCHWVNLVAIVIMVLSGWRIFNASPLFDFVFPRNITLGGWLAGALQWHFAAMWLLVANGLVYVSYGLLAGHYRRSFFPLTPKAIWRDLVDTARGRLSHHLGTYNHVQRIAYLAAIALGTILVLSGLAIWKPVQFQELATLMGGYEGARWVHFVAMVGLVGFALLHVVMVLVVPRTFLPMIVDRSPRVAKHKDR